jgi:N utilization substance protein B
VATRRQVREAVISLLYSKDLGNDKAFECASDFFEERKIRNNQKEFATILLNGLIFKEAEIDSVLKKVLDSWELDRVGAIEKAIMRLGAYEILFGETDRAIVINEAVEIAKLLGAENSAKFVNGVLDAIKR